MAFNLHVKARRAAPFSTALLPESRASVFDRLHVVGVLPELTLVAGWSPELSSLYLGIFNSLQIKVAENHV